MSDERYLDVWRRSCDSPYVKDNHYESHTYVINNPARPFICRLGDRGAMPHWHENIEILYFHSDATVICNRREYTVHPNDIAIFDFNSLHAIPKNSSVCYDCLIFDHRFLSRCDIDVSLFRFDCVIRDEKLMEHFKNVVSLIKALPESDKLGAAEVKSAMLSMMIYLGRTHSRHDDSENNKSGAIKLALGYIRSHYDENLTIEALAERVNVSKFYFCREFRRETGFTVVRYINSVRCDEAYRLLLNSKYSVSEVAHMCGFDNLSYFTRTYKSLVGCTPRETRMSEYNE